MNDSSQTPLPNEPALHVPQELPYTPNLRPHVYLLTAVGLIMLAIGIGAGYFLFGNKAQSLQVLNTPSTQVTQTSPIAMQTEPQTGVPAKDTSTANWKTFTDSTKTYSIKYPSEIFTRFICPGEELDLVPRSGYQEETITMPGCGRDSLYTIQIDTLSTVPNEPKSDAYYSVTSTNITVAGVPAKKYITVQDKEVKGPTGPLIDYSDDVYVVYKGKTYRIHSDKKENESVFTTMLSTFTFIQ